MEKKKNLLRRYELDELGSSAFLHFFGTTEINSSRVRSAFFRKKTTQTAAQRTFIKLEVGASEGQLSVRTLRTRGSGLWNNKNEGRLEKNVINAKQK